MFAKMKTKIALSILIGFVSFIEISHAEIEFLPNSRHQQSLTYGLFTDQQSTLVFRSAGQAWAAVGGFISLVELKDWAYQPQLILHGSSSASMRINTKGDTLLTDTVDARVGLGFDLKFTESLRGSITWTHQSGHISDNVPDTDLIGTNLGNEIIAFRVIKDIDRTFRFGGSLRPFLGTEPKMKAFGADQFLEWFFRGAPESKHQFTPYFAAGFEEYGFNQIDLTFHAQIGFMVGNHFDEIKNSTLRTVFGYYNGVDPRLKYYQFKNRKSEFIYAGVMFDL